MPAKKNPRPFIENAAINNVEEHFRKVEVKGHPRGGYTISMPQVGSTICLYSGNFPTHGAALAEIARLKSAAIAAIMRGDPKIPEGDGQLKFLE